jgi:hypothetical protein
MNLHVATQLMTTLARGRLTEADMARARELAGQGVEQDDFIYLCLRHKVLPLVFHNLAQVCSGIFPEDFLGQVEKGYIFENSLHNLALAEELFLVRGLLGGSGIEAVPFKGVVLAQTLFGDISLRRCLDLDLLIRKEDAAKAVTLLLEDGFRGAEGELPEGRALRSLLEKLTNVSLVRSGKGLALDLQWDIANRFARCPVRLEDMRGRLEEVVLDGGKVLSLPAEELLCYLCIHGVKHRWLFLDLVCCVAELVRVRPDINYPYAVSYARQIGCETVLYLGLCLARDILGAVLPDEMDRAIEASKKIKELAAKAQAGLFTGYRDSMRLPEKFDPFLLQARDNLADQVRYCLKILFIPSAEDLRQFPLPEPLSFLRYPLRPVRLLGNYIRRVVGG